MDTRLEIAAMLLASQMSDPERHDRCHRGGVNDWCWSVLQVADSLIGVHEATKPKTANEPEPAAEGTWAESFYAKEEE